MQLENAIQEAMAELDRVSESQSTPKTAPKKCNNRQSATSKAATTLKSDSKKLNKTKDKKSTETAKAKQHNR